MAGSRPKIEYIQLDERNALIFNDANTAYIMVKIKEATAQPGRRGEIYAEMAKRFHIDPDKMNMAVIRYVDKMKRATRGQGGKGARDASHFSAGSVTSQSVETPPFTAGRERGRRKADAESSGQGMSQKEMAALDEKILMAALCREVGHRFVNIALSHKHGCRECVRCGKHESQYNI